MSKLDPKQFIQAQKYGVLSTHSKSEKGYPFGSITPYIITEQGDIAIFISRLAEHTQNIKSDPKVSLTIFDPTDADDPSAGARITCLAIAECADDETQLRKQYLEQFPTAAVTLELPGFYFYLLKLTKIRLVAGFGQITWLSPTKLNL
ncbi:MAG: HugZ family protein [Methylophagaceae bacterium]